MSLIFRKKKKVLTKDYIVKIAKQTNSNMYLEGQDIDEKKAIEVAEKVAKKLGYKVV